MGFCFTAHCNASCMVEAHPRNCSTPIPTTILTTPRGTVSTTAPYTSSMTPTTTLLDCTDVSPPRKNGEIWEIGNCTTAKCTNGRITTTPISCPSPPFCANGRPPTKGYDKQGCCDDYECPCVCSVWNNKNYLTFDGKYYNFLGNCSYYLVKEIISTYNLTISMTNEACDNSVDESFCPQTVTVDYQSTVVVLNQSKIPGGVQNQIYVNGQQVYPPYNDSKIQITGTDIVVSLKMTTINSTILYGGSSFSIDLPQSRFGKNTEGQCGTCDNSQTNDCRSPNGQVENCTTSAGQWIVNPENCVQPTLPPIPPTIIECTSEICSVLTSSVFKECHKVVPVDKFYESCVKDVCENNCTSLEAYAKECTSAGICLDWRNHTNGLCEHKCPGKKVYKACGPEVESTCNYRYNDKFKTYNNIALEGCFCPNGTTVYNKANPICVNSTCDVCDGPDGKPRQPGETWTISCQKCVCDKDSMSIKCRPVECTTGGAVNCSEPGQQIVNKTNTCCAQQICECNTTLCPEPLSCAVGFTVKATAGVCCQEYTCVPKDVCVYNQKEYQPGEKIPIIPVTTEPPLEAPLTTSGAFSFTASTKNQSSCENCYCRASEDLNTTLPSIVCQPVVCNTTCSEGYAYQELSGQCCGKCVQTKCIVSIDNSTVTIEHNQTFVSPSDKCIKYVCEKVNDQYITTKNIPNCPAFDPLDCVPGTETTDADGCCKSCTRRSVCEVLSEPRVIEVNKCKSKQAVNLTYCSGTCGSSSIYSAADNSFQRACNCCQETNIIQKNVLLMCTDGTTREHTYSLATACACTPSLCPPQRRRRR